MEQLETKEIDPTEANAHAALARQINNIYEYERKMAETKFKLRGSGIEVRDIEKELDHISDSIQPIDRTIKIHITAE